MRWAGVKEMTQETCAEIGAAALAAQTVAEDEWVAYFEDHLEGANWPERPLLLTAVDCETGAFQTWDRDSSAGLGRAVASSCAVPGLFPAVTINGRRYTDGGVRSGTNADLARGYDSVLIVAPIGARPDGIDPLLGRQARAETEALNTAGTSAELVFPDASTLEAMGINRMDFRPAACFRAAAKPDGRFAFPRADFDDYSSARALPSQAKEYSSFSMIKPAFDAISSAIGRCISEAGAPPLTSSLTA